MQRGTSSVRQSRGGTAGGESESKGARERERGCWYLQLGHGEGSGRLYLRRMGRVV